MVDTVQVEGNVTGSEAPVEQTQEARPEWLPEKFNSPEDLSKAYGELEKQYTQSRQEAAQAKEATASDVETSNASETEGEAREAVENAGLNFDDMRAEFAETGELSEQTYKDLQDKGIPKDMVDAYVEGQQARATQYSNEIFSYAGGEESYKGMTEWAADNLSDSEIDAFNDAITSGNTSQARLSGRPSKSFLLVTCSLNLLVSANKFSPNLRLKTLSFLSISLRFIFSDEFKFAPFLKKFL